MSFEIVNKRQAGDEAYVAGFNGKKVGVHAKSLADAKQAALEHFKPRKKERNLIWVIHENFPVNQL